MGLKDMFSSKGRVQSKLERAMKTTTNPYTQSAERYAAMESLLKDGSEEAIVGLFRRFAIVSSKSIEDEEEKGWVYRQLTGLGPSVLPAARRFALESENVAWALRIIEEVADDRSEWEILDALLEQHPPGYERDPTKKQQILTHLSEIDDPSVPELLAPYLEDPDETIRYLVVEQLLDIGDERSKGPLIDRLVHTDEDSLRLRVKILDGLAEHGWDISDRIDEIGPHLRHEHAIANGKIAKR